MTERGAAAGWSSTLPLPLSLSLSLSSSLLRAASSTFGAAALGAVVIVIVLAMAQSGRAEAGSYERTFHQPKSAVEKALKGLQPAMSGRLPVLDGFALTGDRPLSRYQRAYYQTAVRVSSSASGESVVRVSTKVTAWYADSTPSHSGYQLLTSNGRLESDLLDQLADLLASKPNTSNAGERAGESSREGSGRNSSGSFPALNPSTTSASAASTNERSTIGKSADEPAISAPIPQSQEKEKLPEPGRGVSSPLDQGFTAQRPADNKTSPEAPAQTNLQAEAAALEEVLKNQAHPKNIVAIKKSGTPIVESPSLTGKTLFLASAHDEFEMLDFNADWVHVRISGLSRGWIWRTSLEMPEGISDIPLATARGAPVVADLFQVSREETAPFPGDWEPLRGKNVKIISVQKIQENEGNSGAQAKLEYAKSLFDKNYAELAGRSQELAGVVLIFDSVDGGMIAATLPTVRRWKAGTLSDAALWHQCYFDPPETFSVSSPAGGH